MNIHPRRTAGLIAALLLASPLAAQEATAQEAVTAVTAAPDDGLSGAFAPATVADDDILDTATAREDLSLVAQSQQTSSVSNNSINGDSTTGEVRLGENAFQNANGMTIINANSGNNVSMNASINVNIVMVPTASPPQP